MKKIILLFCLFVLSNKTFSQASIGETLDQIKKENPTGSPFYNKENNSFYYMYEDSTIQSKFIFLFDLSMVCYSTVIKPNNKKITKYWKTCINKDHNWVKINSKKWVLERNDGVVIYCDEVKNNKKETMFIFLKN